MIARAHAALARATRWRPWEFIFWILVAASWFVLPERRLLINEMAIAGLFAMSLDLVLGYGGIVSLGHAAFFGFGAYLTGIMAKHGVTDPLLGLLLAGLASAAVGWLSSFLVLRGTDLSRIMVTLSVSLVLFELANRMVWLTGGADGMQGLTFDPILGWFEFDLFGSVGCAYSLIVLFLLFLTARRYVGSPFGWSVRAAAANPLRTAAIGIPVNARLIATYSLAAGYAGIAGSLLAETTQFVSLDVLAFHRSADVMLMLVVGGAGWLYGGIIGALGFKLLQDWLSGLTPQYWQFWIGAFLVALVLVGRERIAAWPARLLRR
jgi:branched-chain amino acid transport system permease protein